MIKEKGYLDLRSDFFNDSPFISINNEILAAINYAGHKIKYITASGVGRVAAFQSVFPNGIKCKFDVLHVHYDLQKRLVAINTLYIYGHRFHNLHKYDISQEEIVFIKKKPKTYKKYRRSRFVKTQKKKFLSKFVPYLGGCGSEVE